MSLATEVEALLFVAEAPTPARLLANTLEATEAEVEQAIDDLNSRYAGTAVQVVRIAGGYQICTRPEYAEKVARFLKPMRQRLSRSLMEVLAIVAYKQPLTLAEIDAIRGVQSDYGLRGLIERRLVREVGRKPTPGRPVLYGTTQQFLHQFNLDSIDALPEVGSGDLPEEVLGSGPCGESIVVQ